MVAWGVVGMSVIGFCFFLRGVAFPVTYELGSQILLGSSPLNFRSDAAGWKDILGPWISYTGHIYTYVIASLFYPLLFSIWTNKWVK